jgi:hypothetical protein
VILEAQGEGIRDNVWRRRSRTFSAMKAFGPLDEDIPALSGQTGAAIMLWGPRTKREIC